MALYPAPIESALAGIPRSKNSRVFFVDPAGGDDDNLGDRWTKPLLTLEEAEDRCTANRNDAVVVLGNNAGLTPAAAITWDKSYTHLVGLAAPTRVGKRARIFQGAALTTSPWFNISGVQGCIFRDLYLFSGVADAAAKVAVALTGAQRCVFDNVHFAGGGHATSAIDAGAALHFTGAGPSENLFKDCVFGVDTAVQGNGWAALVFAATAAAARNVFEDCLFTVYAGHAGVRFVELMANGGIDRYTLFKRCTFINLNATQMDSAFEIAAGFDPANKRFLLQDCALIGADDWDDDDRGALYLNTGTITGGGNAGLFAVAAAT